MAKKTNPIPFEERAILTIRDLVEQGHNEVGIRKAMREGKLVGTKVQMPGRETMRNEFTQEQYKAWRDAVAAHSGARDDGRNKYVLYMTPDELTDLLDRIDGTEYAPLVKRANLKSEEVEAE